MNTLNALLELIPSRDHRRALSALHPMLTDDVKSEVALMLSRFDEEEKSIDATMMHICECVTMVTGIKDITNTIGRKRPIVMARQMVIFCAWCELVANHKITLMQVGGYFKAKYNHALIIHCRKNILNLYATDRDIKRDMDIIAECLYQNGLINTKICLK